MAGAFIALAEGETGFLPDDQASAARQPASAAVTEGQMLLLRVTRAAQGGKGPRLSMRGVPAGVPVTGPVARLARGPEAALRLALAHPAAELLTDGAALAGRLRAALGPDRVRLSAAPVFDAVLEEAFAGLAEPEVPLPGGGRLLILPTPALTAIDVDAGAAAAGRDRAAQQGVNHAAIAEAARQIRLRNLAGPILLDLAGMPAKARAALEPALRAALAGDKLVRLLGLGPLGLFELTRQRIHPPLHEVLGWPPTALTHGLAALRQAVRDAAARPGRPLALRAAPAVLAALAELPGALAECAAALGQPLALQPEPGRRPGQEEIADAA
jgi:hypothetical protein